MPLKDIVRLIDLDMTYFFIFCGEEDYYTNFNKENITEERAYLQRAIIKYGNRKVKQLLSDTEEPNIIYIELEP